MKNITRKQVDKMIELLQDIGTDESNKLSKILKKADVIPKLYQAAYIESLNNIFSKCTSLEKFKEKFQWNFTNEQAILEASDSFSAVKQIVFKAHERQNEICDFEDSTLEQHSTGRCGDESHYENIEYQQFLTDEECIKFKIINEEEGWIEACEYFNDKLNSDEQKLILILNFSDDETKVMKDDGYYICDRCLESIVENSDGNISCDLEMAEHNE